MVTAVAVLLLVALVCFLWAARALYAVRLVPDGLIAAGLASQALAFALVVVFGSTPAPEPPEPPIPTGDYGGYRPHYQGHGTTTPGGRGGEIRRVSSAAGLQEAVRARPGCQDTPQTCARIVIFDASGNYNLGGQLTIDSPYLTLAGQTAPNDGVTLVNTRFLIDTHDVVVQHLRIRQPPRSLNACSVGDAGDGGDNSHVHHVVLDHVTCTWANEVNNLLVAGPGSRDVALLDSFVAEALWPGGLGGIGAGIGYKNTVARSVFSQHWSRQPIWGSPAELALFNNVTYNGTNNEWGNDTLPAFYGDADGEGSAGTGESTVIVNNVLIAGPDSGGVRAILGLSKKQDSIDAGARIYMAGNQGPGIGGSQDDQWAATVCAGSYGTYPNAATCGPQSNVRANEPPAWWNTFKFVVMPTNDVFVKVLQNAGARPRNRDSADTRMIADVMNGTGTHYLDVSSVQMPNISATTRACQIPADPNGVVDEVGRTRIEVYLESDSQCGARRLEY